MVGFEGVGTAGQLKLCDFGFARQLPSSPDSSITDYVSTRLESL